MHRRTRAGCTSRKKVRTFLWLEIASVINNSDNCLIFLSKAYSVTSVRQSSRKTVIVTNYKIKIEEV